MSFIFLMLALLLCWLPVPSWSLTRYVAPGGTGNCTTGQNIATPLGSVGAGIGCMAAGDTLYLRAGTYVETPAYHVNCTVGAQCLIAGYPGDARPVIQSPAGNVSGFTFAFSANGANWDGWTTLKGVTIDGLPITSNTAQNHGISVALRHVTIDDVIVADFPRNAIQIVTQCPPPFPPGCTNGVPTETRGDNAIIRNSQLLRCGRIPSPAGFDVFDTKGLGFYLAGKHILVENNLVDGCYGGGGGASGGDTDDVIVRGTIIRNAGADSPWHGRDPDQEYGKGLVIGGELFTPPGGLPTNVHFYNNVIYNIHGSGDGTCINFLGASNSTFSNNTCYNMTRPYTVICGYNLTGMSLQNNIFAQMQTGINACGTISGAVGNNLSNPNVANTFVNAPAGDFHLKAGSPAIGYGVTLAITNPDIVGTARTVPYDAGAYEFGSAVPPDITSNLLAHWKFNDSAATATDSTGNGRTGTYVGSPVYGPGAPSLGNGLVLNGTSQYATVAAAAPLDLTGAFTIAAWVKPSSALTDWRAVLIKEHVYYLYASSVGVCGAGGIYGGLSDGITPGFACDSTPLASGVWTHLAFTWDGTTARMYRGGTLGPSGVFSTNPIATANPLYLGASAAGEFFPGTLDEIRLYGRALQQPDITALVAVTDGPQNPAVSITEPTTGGTYTTPTSPLINLRGFATDSDGTVTSVAWTCSPGCGSGTATLTLPTWTVPSITLANPTSTITVTATDNTALTSPPATLIVTFAPAVAAPTSLLIVK